MKHFYQNEEFSLSIHVDPDFRGLLRGFANDVSEGCLLTGEIVMDVHRCTKIRSLQTDFVGQIRVNFNTTNSIGIPTSDGVENKVICRKSLKHFNERMIDEGNSEYIKSKLIEPGTYKFPFKFSISAALPQSFEGKHGSILYHMDVTATRTLFSSDIHISRVITLRRCLMNSINPIAPPSQTVNGNMHPDVLTYSATAPSMVYCEGGLLTLEIFIQLKNPERHSIRMVTCGLQERELYRTTGRQSLTNQAMRHDDNSYPLGCSTFFPSNPADLHSYNAIFRLYPRVHSDTKSALIVVLHALTVRIVIDDTQVSLGRKLRRTRSIDSVGSISSIKSVGKSILSHLPLKQQDHNSVKSLPNMVHVTPSNTQVITPPVSPTPSSDSSSSTTSNFINPSSTSLDQLQSSESNVVRVTSRKASPESLVIEEEHDTNVHHNLGHSLAIHHHFNPHHFNRGTKDEGTIECILSLPIIVTSREEYKEGSVPALPDYETAVDKPPSYRATIQNLPPVPTYPIPTNQEDHHVYN